MMMVVWSGLVWSLALCPDNAKQYSEGLDAFRFFFKHLAWSGGVPCGVVPGEGST